MVTFGGGLIEYAFYKQYISESDKKKAADYAKENNCGEYRALTDALRLDEKKILAIYANYNNMQFISDIDDLEPDEELMSRCNSKILEEYKMLPLGINEENGKIQLLITNPKHTLRIEDYLRTIFPGKRYEHILISEKAYSALSADRHSLKAYSDMEMDFEAVSSGVYDISDSSSDSDIVNFVNSVFSDAIMKRASDIHIEPQEKYVRIRYRIDGGLVQTLRFSNTLASRVTNRIKTMASMDVNNSFEPQDGNIRLSVKGMPLDMRVSALPSEYGESLVLRILNKSAVAYNLDTIGLTRVNRQRFERLISCENGIILCTGPTGSGKSTTLYCVVAALNSDGVKIMTAEDPVEIHIDGIIQSAVSQRLTFDDTLRAQLRQDPNILLLGEIRDGETANTAITASNTGHLVLSTLHANSALASISRLRSKSMGLDSYNLGDTLRGIINQRLVRRLCEKCKEEYILEKSSPYYGLLPNDIIADGKPVKVYKPHAGGCKHCGGLGYRGRVGLHELLEISPEISDLIMEDAPISEIRAAAEKGWLRSLSDDSIDKVLMGLTSFDEIRKYIKRM